MQGVGIFQYHAVNWKETGNVTLEISPIGGVAYPDGFFPFGGVRLIRSRLITRSADGSLGSIENPDFKKYQPKDPE